jgi:endo-1,4-beta-mannosidase
MGQDEKIREAQEILNWVITSLNASIKCKVIGYKHENYGVQFLNKEDKLIMPTQIPEEWVKGSNPKENLIHDNLRMLLRNLENYQ